MNDIDLSSIDDWNSIGYDTYSGSFRGTFDGNGHMIKNLTSTQGGLFGYTRDATIKNVGIENVKINTTSTSTSIGGLIGYNMGGTITHCYTTGDISGGHYTGGLVGYSNGAKAIESCYSECNISNNLGKGGLIGSACGQTTISNCYSTGVISGIKTERFETNKFAGSSMEVTFKDCYTTSILEDNLNDSYTPTGVHIANEANKDAIIASFSADVWDLSSYPPTLKNMPGTPKATQETSGNIRLQVGANADADANAIYVDISFSLEDLVVDFSDAESCIKAVEAVDNLLKQINDKMAYIGATQNRLDSVLESQTTQIENFTAAKSNIMDADIAEESAEFTKQQILTQSTGALLVQANRLNANTAINLISSL